METSKTSGLAAEADAQQTDWQKKVMGKVKAIEDRLAEVKTAVKREDADDPLRRDLADAHSKYGGRLWSELRAAIAKKGEQ